MQPQQPQIDIHMKLAGAYLDCVRELCNAGRVSPVLHRVQEESGKPQKHGPDPGGLYALIVGFTGFTKEN